jgi:hypothetical protein
MGLLVEGKFCFRAHTSLTLKNFPPGLYVEGKTQDYVVLTEHKDPSQLLIYVFFV